MMWCMVLAFMYMYTLCVCVHLCTWAILSDTCCDVVHVICRPVILFVYLSMYMSFTVLLSVSISLCLHACTKRPQYCLVRLFASSCMWMFIQGAAVCATVHHSLCHWFRLVKRTNHPFCCLCLNVSSSLGSFTIPVYFISSTMSILYLVYIPKDLYFLPNQM